LRAVQLAVWFHDAVYDPRAKDNETRSAALAAECLGSLAVPSDVIGKVAELVEATAHLSDDRAPADADTAVLLDADLAILGASEARYQRYAADVRREYAFVPDDDYRKGRADVLRRFLARERIYYTTPMHAEGEEAARRNLRAELERL
jgi:predicted metal-dependent HD superfamily phosphohydrolase